MSQKEWTAEKFEPAEEWYDDNLLYCVYCFSEVPEWKRSCCGENHFMTGQELLEREKELDEIDRQRQGASE
jgi:hypothetical protein